MKKLLVKNNVRTLRFLNNEMTQKELAQKVGVSRQTIGAIEKGKYSPSLEVCFKLALTFSKTLDDIFYVELDEKKENL